MKSRIASLTLLAAMTLALALAVLVSERAEAQCTNAFGAAIPCPNTDKQKRPTPTDTRVPRPTQTPIATAVTATPLSLGVLVPPVSSQASAGSPGLISGGLKLLDSNPYACIGALGFAAILMLGAFLFPPTREAVRRILSGNRSKGGSDAFTVTSVNPWGDSSSKLWSKGFDKPWDQSPGSSAGGSVNPLNSEQDDLSEFNKGGDSGLNGGSMGGSGG